MYAMSSKARAADVATISGIPPGFTGFHFTQICKYAAGLQHIRGLKKFLFLAPSGGLETRSVRAVEASTDQTS